jgi:hypothetical protein
MARRERSDTRKRDSKRKVMIISNTFAFSTALNVRAFAISQRAKSGWFARSRAATRLDRGAPSRAQRGFESEERAERTRGLRNPGPAIGTSWGKVRKRESAEVRGESFGKPLGVIWSLCLPSHGGLLMG